MSDWTKQKRVAEAAKGNAIAPNGNPSTLQYYEPGPWASIMHQCRLITCRKILFHFRILHELGSASNYSNFSFVHLADIVVAAQRALQRCIPDNNIRIARRYGIKKAGKIWISGSKNSNPSGKFEITWPHFFCHSLKCISKWRLHGMATTEVLQRIRLNVAERQPRACTEILVQQEGGFAVRVLQQPQIQYAKMKIAIFGRALPPFGRNLTEIH